MNCQVVQNKILTLPDPRVVPDPLRAHVVGCAACQAWAKQAARLEALLEQLPDPARAGRQEGCADRQAHPRRRDHHAARGRAVPSRASRGAGQFLRRNATVVGGLAAAMLVALGVWALFPGTAREARDGAAASGRSVPRKIVQRDLALAKAKTPAERLQVLSGLADDLSAQARSLARVASPDELRDLARWYDRVVKDAHGQAGRELPADR